MEGQRFQLQELFRYERHDNDGAAPGRGGRYVPSGGIPTFYDTLDAQGLRLDRACFHVND